MSASDFLRRLDVQLRQLPPGERENALAYYRDYFADAGIENEQKVLEELGSPEKLGAEIVADYYYKNGAEAPMMYPKKKGMPLAVKIILGIILCPIILILLIAFAAVLFAIFIIPVSLMAGGVIYFLGGIAVMLINIPTGFMVLGEGLLAAGIGLLLCVPVKRLMVISWHGIVRMFHRLTRKGEVQ